MGFTLNYMHILKPLSLFDQRQIVSIFKNHTSAHACLVQLLHLIYEDGSRLLSTLRLFRRFCMMCCGAFWMLSEPQLIRRLGNSNV